MIKVAKEDRSLILRRGRQTIRRATTRLPKVFKIPEPVRNCQRRVNERVPSEIRHYPNQQSKLEICWLRRLRTIYFFSAILRAISSMSFGPRLARTLSTMLETSAKSLFGAAE